MNREGDKVTAICFSGATTTGKTLLAGMKIDPLRGMVTRRGDKNKFRFDSFIMQYVCQMELPRITATTKVIPSSFVKNPLRLKNSGNEVVTTANVRSLDKAQHSEICLIEENE
ncbi:hypothetical protein ACTXT7_004057 [Hymenolepis weldensis]